MWILSRISWVGWYLDSVTAYKIRHGVYTECNAYWLSDSWYHNDDYGPVTYFHIHFHVKTDPCAKLSLAVRKLFLYHFHVKSQCLLYSPWPYVRLYVSRSEFFMLVRTYVRILSACKTYRQESTRWGLLFWANWLRFNKQSTCLQVKVYHYLIMLRIQLRCDFLG